jgi:hypothetical protein
MPPLGKLRVTKVCDVYTGNALLFEGDSGVSIRDIDRTSSPADSVIAVTYNDDVRHVWAK